MAPLRILSPAHSRPQHIRLTVAILVTVWMSFASWPAAQPRQIVRPTDGFALAIPAGWTERTDLGATAGMAPASGTEAYVTVHVQREPAPAAVNEVLARVATKMKADTTMQVVSSRLGTFLNRRALLAELQDVATRYRVVVIPRDTGDTSQIYYTLMAWCAPASFAQMQSAFDLALTGFEVTPAPSAPGTTTQIPAAGADRGAMKTTTFSLAPAPFSGEVPEGWTGTKVSAVLYVFRGPQGTGAFEAGVHIEVAPKATFPGKTIEDMLGQEQAAVLKYKGGVVLGSDTGRTIDGRPLRMTQTNYTCSTSAGIETVCQRITGLIEYPDYFIYVKYVAPKSSWNDFTYAYETVGNSLTYGLNRTAPVPQPAAAPAPPPASTPPPTAAKPAPPTPPPTRGGQAFTIDAPPYGGEMPRGWTMQPSGSETFIFAGAQGTEPSEVKIRLVFYPKAGASIDAMAATVRDALQKVPGAEVVQTTDRQTSEGRAARAFVANYPVKDAAGVEQLNRQMLVVVEYTDHLVVLGYSGPVALFEKYMSAFEMVGSSLNERR